MCAHVMCVSRGRYTLQQTCLLNFWLLWPSPGNLWWCFWNSRGAPKLPKEGRVSGGGGWLKMRICKNVCFSVDLGARTHRSQVSPIEPQNLKWLHCPLKHCPCWL